MSKKGINKIPLDNEWDKRMLTRRTNIFCISLLVVILMDRLVFGNLSLIEEIDSSEEMTLMILGLFSYLLFFSIVILFGVVTVFKTLRGMTSEDESYILIDNLNIEYKTKLTYLDKKISITNINKIEMHSTNKGLSLIVHSKRKLGNLSGMVTLYIEKQSEKELKKVLNRLSSQGVPIHYIVEGIVK